MRSFSPTCGIFLVSLFSKLSVATITIDELPLSLKSGTIYNIGWSSDRDYVSSTRVSSSPLEVPLTIPSAHRRLLPLPSRPWRQIPEPRVRRRPLLEHERWER